MTFNTKEVIVLMIATIVSYELFDQLTTLIINNIK